MFCKNVWGVDAKGDEAVSIAIQKTEAFFNSLGIKTRLSDYGIGEDVVNEIVRRFRERGSMLGEHGIVTPDKVDAILRDRL
jgi:NADP-dependent alcohol dehydrogenase